MAKINKTEWFLAGARILAAHGAQALTVDRLAAEAGVTKGSFYHHFEDFTDYKHGLLEHVTAEDSSRIIAFIELGSTPLQKLRRMFDWASNYPPDLALALQAWALQDAEVRVVQADVYARQLAYATALCGQLVPDKAQARLIAQMAFAMLIGSLHVQAHLPKNAHRKFFDELQHFYGLNE